MSFLRRNLEVLGVRDAATKVSAFMRRPAAARRPTTRRGEVPHTGRLALRRAWPLRPSGSVPRGMGVRCGTTARRFAGPCTQEARPKPPVHQERWLRAGAPPSAETSHPFRQSKDLRPESQR